MMTLVIALLCPSSSRSTVVAQEDGGLFEHLTDETLMSCVADKRVYAVLFHKTSDNSDVAADSELHHGDQAGGALIDEMNALATLSKGQCDPSTALRCATQRYFR